jgi:hypothetical protein
VRRKLYIYIFLIALGLNLVWENLHAPLYQVYNPIMRKVFFIKCALADAFITLLVYFLVTQLLKNPYWIRHLIWKYILVAFLVSMVISVVMEKSPLYLGWWSYGAEMPVLPWIQVGLSPFLQLSLLPSFTFFLVYLFSGKAKKV